MLAQAQKTLATDQTNLTRDQMLTGNGYIAQQLVDQQAALVANDQQSVRNLQASLTTAQALLTANGTMSRGLPASIIQQGRADIATSLAQAAQIEAQIVRATIYSPTDGVVVNRNLNTGEYPGTRQIFTIQQLDPVYAVLSASGMQIGSIRRGAAVKITSANQPTHSYPGTVVAILGQVNPGSTNFIVKARLENPDWRLSPVLNSGTVVSATITLRPIRGIGVPATALLTDAHDSVMVVSNGTTRTVAVHELGSNGTTSIVTGLSPGALVVNDGQLGLSDGQQVAVTQ
jgi:RND family efflux transporter MFP subunit